MKLILSVLLISVTVSTNFCFAQGDTTFFNKEWANCTRKDATFYRLVEKTSGNYLVRDFYLQNNQPQMVVHCSSLDPLIKEGKCTYYRENGKKDGEGLYVDNRRTGTWTWWDTDNKDSSVAECSISGDIKWIRKTVERSNVHEYVQTMPEFPGGDKALMQYLSKHVKYPKQAVKNKTEGTVLLSFIVDEKGMITEVTSLRDVGDGCTEEAIRVVKGMPKWKPGVQDGAKVKVQYHLPITFKL